MSLVFLDTETTGLDPFIHDIWEVAFAVDDGPIADYILVHSLKTADPAALELNDYWGRFPQGARSSGPWVDQHLRKVFEGATIVGANPAFDAMFLQHRWRAQPWHYRLLDISSMSVAVFGFRGDGKPPGLVDVANECRRFAEVPEPDHTAAGDVATLRACYRVLSLLPEQPQRYMTGMGTV